MQPESFIKGEEEPKTSDTWRSYSQVKQLRFSNTSAFDVSDIRGSIAFRTQDGERLGTVPFRASGFVYAGATMVLEVESNELRGKSDQSTVTIESVHVWN